MSLTGAGQGGLKLLALVSVAAVVFFFKLGDTQLWDRDEPRNAGCAIEMLQRQDWVVPIFNDELRFQKPVLLYWLIMSAYQVLGVTEFAARFGSAVLAVGTVGATFLIARKLFDPKTAFLSGIILSSSLMFVVAARAATPDSALIFFSTLAIGCFVWGSACNANHPLGPQPPLVLVRSFDELRLGWLVLMGVSMAMAILTKGPVGFVMPMAIMGMFLLIARSGDRRPKAPQERQTDVSNDRDQNEISNLSFTAGIGQRLLKIGAIVHPVHFFQTTMAMRPLLLLAISLLISAPWFLGVGARTDGDFLRIFFLSEHLQRATTSLENHRGGLWFYPAAIMVGFFPWSLFWMPLGIVLYRLRERLSDGMLMGICWVGVQVAIFSIVQTKLPSYVTPCYPALAMLTAACLQSWMQKTVTLSDRWMVAVMITGIGVGVTITIGATVAMIYYLPGKVSLPAAGLVLVASGMIGLAMLKEKKISAAIDCFSIAAIIFTVVLTGFVASDVASLQNNRTILDPISQLPEDIAVASFNCMESSWPYYSRRTIYETSGEAEAQSVRRLKDWKPKPVTTPESFVQQYRDSVFITNSVSVNQLLAKLPEDYVVLKTADYFLKRDRLVLIGPADRFPALSPQPQSP